MVKLPHPESENSVQQMALLITESAKAGRQRRDDLVKATRDLSRGIHQLAASDWQDKRATPCRIDRESPASLLGGQSVTPFEVTLYESCLNLRSVADQLDGFAVLLQAERSLMGAVAVSRGVFEASIWTAALIDPTLTVAERQQRSLSRRLARLSAGVRLHDKLTRDRPAVSRDRPAHPDDTATYENDHRMARDARQDIEEIVAHAHSRGWPVKRGRRAWEIGGPLTIDWLVENLEGRVGLEGYAWASGSSMAHGEHAADTASWMQLASTTEIAPAWLMALWSTGAWAGPRLLLSTFEKYTGRSALKKTFNRFEESFWALK